MRAAIAQHDWSRTSLRAVENWPDTLKTVLGFVLDTAFPMLIMWGPDLIQVYNDGYIVGHTVYICFFVDGNRKPLYLLLTNIRIVTK